MSFRKVVDMKLMFDGIWRGDVAPAVSAPSYPIEAGSFRGRLSADGSSGFAAELGRYHLYASYACPFAHRVILA
jgi:putative glutathione S-transferase